VLRSSADAPVPLSEVLGPSAGLLPDDGTVVYVGWWRAIGTRLWAWSWPYGIPSVAISIPFLFRAFRRSAGYDGVRFLAVFSAVAIAAGALFLWRFYRGLPNGGYPVLFRIALRKNLIPGVESPKDPFGVAPVTSIVVLPRQSGLGIVSGDRVGSLRSVHVRVEVECARTGRVAKAKIHIGDKQTDVVAAGNIYRSKRPRPLGARH
jgi:hypothetical protein